MMGIEFRLLGLVAFVAVVASLYSGPDHFNRAQSECERIARETGMRLHETPEWSDTRGLTCVFDYNENCPGLMFGSGPGFYNDKPLCIVEVAYGFGIVTVN